MRQPSGTSTCHTGPPAKERALSLLLLPFAVLGAAGGCGEDAAETVPRDASAGGDGGLARDAGSRLDAGPWEGGPEDGGSEDAGPKLFGLPLCDGVGRRASLVTFTGGIEVDLDEETPTPLFSGDTLGGRRAAVVLAYASDRDLDWVAQVDADTDVVGEVAHVAPDGSIYGAFRVTTTGAAALVFRNADGSEGARFSRCCEGPGPFFPDAGGSLSIHNQQVFVVRYSPGGEVAWAVQLGYARGSLGERGTSARGLASAGGRILVAAFARSAPVDRMDTTVVMGGVQAEVDSGPIQMRTVLDPETGMLAENGAFWVARSAPGLGATAPLGCAGGAPGADPTLAGTVHPGDPLRATFEVGRPDAEPELLPAEPDRYAYLLRFDRSTGARRWLRTITGAGTDIGRQLVSPDGATLLVGWTDDTDADGGSTAFQDGADGLVVLTPSLGSWAVRYDAEGDLRWTQRFAWDRDPGGSLFREGMAGPAAVSPEDNRLLLSGTARGTEMEVRFGASASGPVRRLRRDQSYVAAMDWDRGEVTGVWRHEAPLVPLEARGPAPRFEVVSQAGARAFLDTPTPIELALPGGARAAYLFRVGGIDGLPRCALPVAQGIDLDLVTAVDESAGAPVGRRKR